VAQAYEQFCVDIARITVSVAKRTYEETGKLSVKVPGKRFIEKIDWKEVDLDDDEFQLQIYPVSKLPNDPEGRLATIQEMMQAGLLAPDVGRRLLDFPDLEAEENLSNSMIDYLHTILDKIVEDGDFTAPEPFDNLQKARSLALEYYAMGKLNKLAEDRLELLRKFIKQIDMLTPSPQPAPGPGGVQGVPAAQPVSQLMPNAQPSGNSPV
jgi:hypothetical protein